MGLEKHGTPFAQSKFTLGHSMSTQYILVAKFS
jgi:hypothetical protein